MLVVLLSLSFLSRCAYYLTPHTHTLSHALYLIIINLLTFDIDAQLFWSLQPFERWMHTRRIVLDAKPTEEQSTIFTNKPALYLKNLWAYCWSLLLLVTNDEDFSMFFNFTSRTAQINTTLSMSIFLALRPLLMLCIFYVSWIVDAERSLSAIYIYFCWNEGNIYAYHESNPVRTWLDMSNNIAN